MNERIRRLFLLLALLLVAFAMRSFILSRPVVTLANTPALAGQASQGLGLNNSGVLPVYGQDFTVDNHYFDGASWVVTTIKPLGQSGSDRVYAVFEQKDGVYQPVLAPGTSFTANQVSSLPADVVAYIQNVAAISEGMQ